MIADLSSFLEVACAMYASICIDDRFSIKLWELDFSEDVHSAVQNDAHWEENELAEVANKAVKRKFSNIYLGFRLLGTGMMLICIALLCITGFEEKDYSGILGMNIAVFMFVPPALLIVFCFVCSKWRFSPLLRVLIYIAIGVFIAFHLPDVAKNVLMGCKLEENEVKGLVIFFLTVPFIYMVMWRLFLSARERVYISMFLKEELGNIVKVRSAYEKKSKLPKGDVPEEYYTIMGKYSYANMGEDFSFESDLANVFQKRFCNECKVPGILGICLDLLWSYVRSFYGTSDDKPTAKKS